MVFDTTCQQSKLRGTDPNGLTYLGNDFANGRSTTGGSADLLNNVEVVLIDSAIIGTWTVEIIDANHGGSRGQPFSSSYGPWY